MRKVNVWSLKPGMKVGRPVHDSMGFLLLNSGVVLKKEYIDNLKKLNIPAVYIVDNIIPDVEVKDIILDETREKANNLVRDLLKDVEKQPEKSTPKLLFTKKELSNVIGEIIDQLFGSPNLIINLSDIRTTDNYTFSHCVNVAVLALTTAISMGFTTSELQQIGLGTMLHDLGKTKIPLKILNKEGQLIPEERKEIEKHPKYGYDLAKLNNSIDNTSAKIIYQHHERINGQGYPEGINGEQIHIYSRLVAIVDVYDALVSDRPYRKAYPPYKALQILEAEGDNFDLEILQKFLQHVAAYPIGTVVGLSSGEIGIAVENKVGFTMRPKVRIFCLKENLKPVKPYEVDLIQELNIVVDKIYNEDELPDEVIKMLY